MIRSFLGEVIASTSDMLQREESTEFEDESMQVKLEEQFSNRVEAIAKKLPITGMQEADRWQTLHPANNGPVVGIVVEWKASSAQLAGQFKSLNQTSSSKTNEAINRMNSGAGSSPGVSSSGGTTPSNTPRISNANSGQGVRSRDF